MIDYPVDITIKNTILNFNIFIIFFSIKTPCLFTKHAIINKDDHTLLLLLKLHIMIKNNLYDNEWHNICLDKYDIIINTVTLQQEQEQEQEQLQPLIKCNRQIQQLTSTPLFQHQRYNINQMIDLEKNPLTIKLIMGLTQCITIPGSPIDNMWFNYSKYSSFKDDVDIQHKIDNSFTDIINLFLC